MRLQVFQAATMAEAMAQLRAALGSDAIILGNRRTGDGVEVTAGIEIEGLVLIPPDAPPALPGGAASPGLMFHNLPPALAHKLAAGRLEDTLVATLRFAPPPDGAPLLLVGPPGSGKTLTCAKLAARLVLGGSAPLVVTADGARAGGAEQLAAFTRLLGLTLAVARQPATLARALEQRPAGLPVLIDTAGCDPFDPAQAALLRELVAAAGATVLLALPAGLDPAEAAELGAAFAALGATHLLPTRLDLSRRLGGVLAAAASGNLAFSEAGAGAGVADGLLTLTPALLAERLRGVPGQPLGAAAP